MKIITGLKTENPPQLIPVFKKPERRLLSVFMAVLDIVPEFRGEVLKSCGYRTGKTCDYQSFMEPHYEPPSLPNRYPDGLMVCLNRGTSWSAFIEAKAEGNKIRAEQVQEYADFANRLNIDAVISISNEYARTPSELPYHLPGNKRRKREVYHLSWPEIRTSMGVFIGSSNSCSAAELAVIQHALSYMLSDRSGVETFDAMPQDWVKFVESANTDLGFSKNQFGVMEIVRGWQQERRDLCAKLNGEAGGNVVFQHPSGPRSTPKECLSYDKNLLADKYRLDAGYEFKKSKSKLQITSDLRACSHRVALQIETPPNKKAKGTVSWLVSQLADISNKGYDLRIIWPGREKTTKTSIEEMVKYPEQLYLGHKDAPRSVMLIARHRDVRRFKSRKRFIEDVESTTIALVRDAIYQGIL